MCVLGKQETLLLYTIGENHHSNPIRSSFMITVPLPFSLIRSIKTLLFEYPDIFGIFMIKQKILVFLNTDFIHYGPYPFCAYFRR